ncbi:Atypical alkaline phosphatase with phytase-like insertion [Synechococcus sp. WH 7803]|nr:Atypical alkaline phosphatase with phytase-like insertion [Synechococcus sp. WH 7803]
MSVGVLPDSLAFNADGTVIVVANEGEPNEFYTKDESSDPVGSISVISVNSADPGASTVVNLGFDAYDSQLDLLRAQGIRISGVDSADGIEGNLVSQDLEPEYVSISGNTAYISAQENNAVIAVDITDPAAPSITSIFPLGFKDWDRGIATTSNYDVAINYPGSTTSQPNDQTGGAAGSIIAGGLSGLWWDGSEILNGSKTDIFYTISDRGPQANDVPDDAANGAGEKLFDDPDYPITIFKLGFDGDTVSELDSITLKVPDGNGGFRNSTGIGALPNHDLAFTPDGEGDYEEVPRDAFGLDSESVLRLTIEGLNDGKPVFAVSDEYFPQVAIFDAESGNLIQRYVPEDTDFSAVTYEAGRGNDDNFTSYTIPPVYSDRRNNRGFEGLAYNSDDGLLYAFIQTPMRPDGYASDDSLRRILALDPISGEAKAEYLFLQTGPANQDKIGDAVYDATRGTFLVIDRDSGTALNSNKSVLEFDLRYATNVLGKDWQADLGVNQPEELAPAALAAALTNADISTVTQKDLFNLPSVGAPASFDKPEGLALTSDGRLFVNYDNDFVRADGRADNQLTEIKFADLIVDTTNTDDEFAPGFRPFYGMRMADGTAALSVNGETFFFTANEGDGRTRPDDVNFEPGQSSTGADEYFVEIVADATGRTVVPGFDSGFTDAVDGNTYFVVESTEGSGTEIEAGEEYFITFKYGIGADDEFYNDETRLRSYEDFSNLQEAAASQAGRGQPMGRLKTLNTEVYLSQASADAEAPDQVIGLGGRSFSIFDSNGNVVYDSGNLTEMAAAITGSYPDGRSDDKGTEPETVTLGTIDGRTVALIALERSNNVAVFDVTDPRNAQFLQILDVEGDSGLVSPEGITMAGENVLISNEDEPGIAIYGLQPEADFTLQLLHSSDNESNFLDINSLENKVVNYAAITDGLEDLATDRGWASLHITAGDISLPGLFYEAGEEAFGGGGLGDIAIYNALGIQANGIGNHEFDAGIDDFVAMVQASDYVHLSANLDFSNVANAPFVSYEDGEAARNINDLAGQIAPSAFVELNGQQIGLIGRTPDALFSLVEDGNLEGLGFVGGTTGEGTARLPIADPLSLVQNEINRLRDQGINKIILIDHAQDYTDQPILPNELDGVDIIVQAGMTGYMSGDLPFGPFDLLRPEEAGDANPVTDPYPIVTNDSLGKTVLLTNTEQLWRYVGNLVVDFDANGDIINYNDLLSGPVPTTAEGIAALKQFVPGSDIAPSQDVVDAYNRLVATGVIQDAFTSFGTTSSSLNGLRADVRSRETNLSRLTADSTLWYANQYLVSEGESGRVDIALKNGGGIRDTINGPDVLALDIAAALAFNNRQTILDLTGAQFLAAVENGVSRVPALDGRFPHFAGIELEFDINRPGISGQSSLNGASRVNTLIITRDDGTTVDLVRNFAVNEAALNETFTLATNSFIAGGGDGYQAFANLPDTLETEIGEQEILETYIQDVLNGAVTLSDEEVIADPRSESTSLLENSISGTAENDTLSGDGAHTAIEGLDGDDRLDGGDGNDDLQGNRGNDVLTGGLGADLFRLSKGNDTITDFNSSEGDRLGFTTGQGYIITQSGDGLVITRPGFGTTTLTGISGEDFNAAQSLINFETQISGTDGIDQLTGDIARDIIEGLDGDDLINGGDGNDDLQGNRGNDTLIGGRGSDRFLLSKDNDVILDFSISDGDVLVMTRGQNYELNDLDGGTGMEFVRDGFGTTTLLGISTSQFDVNTMLELA